MTLNDTYPLWHLFSKILAFSYASLYLSKLCHICKKSFWRLSKTLLSILESSCYGSEKLSELYFLFWPLLMSGACHQFRPRRVVFYGCFQYKRSFFRNAGAKVQFFWAENKNMAKKVRKKVCKYLIYSDIYKIEFCI